MRSTATRRSSATWRVALRVMQPAVVRPGEHLAEADAGLGLYGRGLARLAAEDAPEDGALGIEVHRLALERGLGEHAPRHRALTGEGRQVLGVLRMSAAATFQLSRASRCCRSAGVGCARPRGAARRRARPTRRSAGRSVDERHAQLDVAVDDVGSIDHEFVRQPWAGPKTSKPITGKPALRTAKSRHNAQSPASARARPFEVTWPRHARPAPGTVGAQCRPAYRAAISSAMRFHAWLASGHAHKTGATGGQPDAVASCQIRRRQPRSGRG